tara:strand:- start:348 stop:632 length:285 start_codon:yes stop_codon:yes gene_type:complete
MYYQKSRGFANYNFLRPIAIAGIVTALVLPSIEGCIKRNLYDQAKPYAIQTFGDKVAPLTPEEKKEWFEYMGVKEGKEVSRSQLKTFLDDFIDA